MGKGVFTPGADSHCPQRPDALPSLSCHLLHETLGLGTAQNHRAKKMCTPEGLKPLCLIH